MSARVNGASAEPATGRDLPAKGAPEREVPSADVHACIWSVDRDGFQICTTRRSLRRAVETTTNIAAQVRSERAKEVAVKRKLLAIAEFAAHHCTPVGGGREGTVRPEAHNLRAKASPPPTVLASIMADVAVLVQLGKRAGAPDVKADYDAAYNALENRIATILENR